MASEAGGAAGGAARAGSSEPRAAPASPRTPHLRRLCAHPPQSRQARLAARSPHPAGPARPVPLLRLFSPPTRTASIFQKLISLSSKLRRYITASQKRSDEVSFTRLPAGAATVAPNALRPPPGSLCRARRGPARCKQPPSASPRGGNKEGRGNPSAPELRLSLPLQTHPPRSSSPLPRRAGPAAQAEENATMRAAPEWSRAGHGTRPFRSGAALRPRAPTPQRRGCSRPARATGQRSTERRGVKASPSARRRDFSPRRDGHGARAAPAPGSLPRRHHHVVNDEVGRGQGSRALLPPRLLPAVTVVRPAPAAARRRHVAALPRPPPALGARREREAGPPRRRARSRRHLGGGPSGVRPSGCGRGLLLFSLRLKTKAANRVLRDEAGRRTPQKAVGFVSTVIYENFRTVIC